MEFQNLNVFEDEPVAADGKRREYLDGINALINRLKREEKGHRRDFVTPESLAARREYYREEYAKMLGVDKLPKASRETECVYYGEDDAAKIFRLTVYATDEVPMYAMLFIPRGVTEGAPLVIAQHGGGGTPELAADMNGKNNYNHMIQRLLMRGAVVIAPQLLLWAKETIPTAPGHPIDYDRRQLDASLKRFGLSITALEIRGIMRCIDFGTALPEVDRERVGMIGLSYGGYFTLHTAALDTRIKSAFSCGCFNDRSVYDWCDWTYPSSAYRFADAEIAGLCAPRALYIAVGKQDSVFHYESAIPEGERATEFYRAAGCENSIRFLAWEGGHTVPEDDEGYNFLFERMKENV